MPIFDRIFRIASSYLNGGESNRTIESEQVRRVLESMPKVESEDDRLRREIDEISGIKPANKEQSSGGNEAEPERPFSFFDDEQPPEAQAPASSSVGRPGPSQTKRAGVSGQHASHNTRRPVNGSTARTHTHRGTAGAPNQSSQHKAPVRRFDTNQVRDAYRTLGVAVDASPDQIKAAYRRLIAQYHPDRVSGQVPHLVQGAQQRSAEINAAYNLLRSLRGF